MNLVMIGASAPSHTCPSLALVRELAAHGHRVSPLSGERLGALVERVAGRQEGVRHAG